MTTTEKTYVATLVAFLCAISQNPKGIKYFSDTCRELGVSSHDVQNCTSQGPAFKDKIYASLRSLSANDKKLAQQYLINAALADGSDVAGLILYEIIQECNMIDHVL